MLYVRCNTFLLHHYFRALVKTKTEGGVTEDPNQPSINQYSKSQEGKVSTSGGESLQVGEDLHAGGTTSGGESGGSPITVLRMQMEDGKPGTAQMGMVPTSTQTEQPTNEDKETMMTREEVDINEMTNTECRETQV